MSVNEFDVVVVGHGAAAQAVLRELQADAPPTGTNGAGDDFRSLRSGRRPGPAPAPPG